MTLPVRVGVRVTRFAVNTALSASARALTLAGGVVQSVTGQHQDAPPRQPERRHNGAAPEETPSRAPTQTPPKRAPASRAEPPPAEPELAEPEPAEPELAEPELAEPELAEMEPEPVHVSEEVELVAEVAEPGAEEGAGASITVDEPWDGYAQLSAKDVIDRLAHADPAELAAIQLFENAHKKRETVLAAVERELRNENASSPPDRPH